MGVKWEDIPKEYKPHWSSWKIEGTALEDVQKRLGKMGLKDPWLRNEVWSYRVPDRFTNFSKIGSRGMVSGFVLFAGLLVVEKLFSSSSKSSSSDHH
uniref:NADH dehydrogenase [ubiquinone] 1 beta subcomplex subunit 3 n=1 Tax=Ciona savignyi TaxID=51511 RepID=H2Y635_CIOSA